MIYFRIGDILKQDAQALVNTVNCVGVMGRGIALQFKKAFPANFKAYESACKIDEVKPGSMFIYDTGSMYNPRYIINFPTKRHWKGKSRMEDVKAGLHALAEDIKRYNISSIAIPPLGCGLGGLDWNEVRQEIISVLSDVGADIYVFEPGAAPSAEKMVKSEAVPNMTVGRASLIALMRRYLSAVMDPTVTLLELQKLMYFMQEAGEPLRLKYQKAPYGPYAQNLGHVLKVIEGHFVLGYKDGGDDPKKPLELIKEAIDQAEDFLKSHQATRNHFEQVTDLIQGFETPYGMELLASVHWTLKHEGVGHNSVVDAIHNWNDRKKMFPSEHIHAAAEVLQAKGWVSA
jgi:O-acetyl-ADP-ribose deacetylase (regulator of RNase III)